MCLGVNVARHGLSAGAVVTAHLLSLSPVLQLLLGPWGWGTEGAPAGVGEAPILLQATMSIPSKPPKQGVLQVFSTMPIAPRLYCVLHTLGYRTPSVSSQLSRAACVFRTSDCPPLSDLGSPELPACISMCHLQGETENNCQERCFLITDTLRTYCVSAAF